MSDQDLSLLAEATHLAELGHLDRIGQLLRDPQRESEVKEFSGEIITLLAARLMTTSDTGSLEEALLAVAQVGDPKLCIIAVLEILCDHPLSTAEGRLQFVTLLHPLREALFRIEEGNRRHRQWSFALSSLVNNLRKLPPLPSSEHLEAKERAELESDENLSVVLDVVDEFVNFVEPFFDSPSEESKAPLVNVILCLLEKPFSHCNLHVEVDNTLEPRGRQICKRLLRLLATIVPNFVECLLLPTDANNLADDTETEDLSMSQMGLGTVFYLVYSEKSGPHTVPLCYHPEYLLQSLLPLVNMLILSHDWAQIHKGLLLLDALVRRLNDRSVSKDLISCENVSDLVRGLVRAITTMDVLEYRRLAFAICSSLYRKLQMEARSSFFISVHSAEGSPCGLRGWILSLLKDTVIENMRSGHIDFRGANLEALCARFFVLRNGKETDIVEEKEEVLAALNCIGCLLRIDADNVTGIQELRGRLDANYIQPVKNTLNLATVYYQVQLQELLSNKEQVPAFTLEGFPQLNLEEKVEGVRHALNVLDFIKLAFSTFSL